MKRTLIALALMASAAPATAQSFNKDDLAIRLVAVTAFVDKNCIGMSPNFTMLGVMLAGIDVDIDALKKRKGYMMKGEVIIRALSKDVKGNCKEAWAMFGENGTQIPGIIEKD